MEHIYIPIGSNCEISHYLRKNKMRYNAFPFDWNCSSLKSVFEILSSKFDLFLNDISIGTKIKRMYFNEDTNDNLQILNEYIYPVICKKYLILLPHDYNAIDDETLVIVKEKYNRRIQRFYNTVNNKNLKIIMIYTNIDFKLNEWQKSVYDECKINVEQLQKDNHAYIKKISELYENIIIMSFEEFKKIYH